MIKIIDKQGELTVKYNNQIVIKHTVDNPSFYFGNGNEQISEYRGNYDIQDNIEKKIDLNQYTVSENKIIFYSSDIKLNVLFEEEENRLIIKLSSDKDYNRFWIRLYATEDEKVYGCGEQYSYFNLRNREFPIWTSEAGVGRFDSETKVQADKQDKAGGNYYTTYYPESTFISSRKYWANIGTYSYTIMNFKNSNYHEIYTWSLPKTITISYEESFLDLVNDITNFTGRLPELPDFLLNGIVLGVQGGIDKVLGYLKKSKDSGVRVSGLWCQDWAGNKYTSFGKRLYWNWQLDEKVYPNLKEKIIELEKEDVSFLTYICPFLLAGESLFNEGKENDFLAFDKQGDVYLVDFGEFDCGIVDLTNPKAFEWYKDKIKTNIIDLGVKSWMADFGEYLPVDCVLYNQKDAKHMHNEWPVLWAKCNYEAVEESGLLGKIFYFMRSGSHGSQRYATCLWAGDQSVNWETHDGIPSVIPATLSAGLIGNPFMHSDIGGYTSLYGNIRTKELFERWLEMNVFSSFMRTHEGNRPDQNFQFYNDDSTLKLMARMTNIRYDLKPYIKELIKQGSIYGYPVQRPLFMHYENDESLYEIQDAYLFGEDILIKPILKPNQKTQEVYLPDDTWIHLWTNQEYKGKQSVVVDAPIGCPPVFYRKKSLFKALFENISDKYLIEAGDKI